MRNHRLLFIVACALFIAGLAGCGSPAPSSFETPEALGNALFEIIKDKDVDGLRRLCITKEDLRGAFAASELPEDQKKMADSIVEQDWEEMARRMDLSTRAEMEIFFRQLESMDLDPGDASLKEVTAREAPSNEGFPQADVRVTFRLGEKEYFCELSRAGRMERSWLIGPTGLMFRETED